MQGYLLDTNIIAYWFNANRSEHPRVKAHIKALPVGAPLFVSAITLGEIEYGIRSAPSVEDSTLAQFREWAARSMPEVLRVQKSTSIDYGPLLARLFEKFTPPGAKRPKRTEQLIDPATSLQLGIQENDLWLAAQAIEHHLVLVTHDDMDHIHLVAQDELKIEDWVT